MKLTRDVMHPRYHWRVIAAVFGATLLVHRFSVLSGDARIEKVVSNILIPRDLPYASEFVINLKTAKQIGLTIPRKVLARADKVIH